MKLHSIVVAAALCAIAGSASAATRNIDLTQANGTFTGWVGERHTAGAFTDSFTFTNYTSPASLVTSSLTNTATPFSSITFTGATLNGRELDLSEIPFLGTKGYVFKDVAVSGPLTLVVSGIANVTGGTVSYGGNFTVSAVPEPATYGMLAGGLGVLAFAARRRKG